MANIYTSLRCGLYPPFPPPARKANTKACRAPPDRLLFNINQLQPLRHCTDNYFSVPIPISLDLLRKRANEP
jgi:hypothetical protein